jgi:hypothetical protein
MFTALSPLSIALLPPVQMSGSGAGAGSAAAAISQGTSGLSDSASGASSSSQSNASPVSAPATLTAAQLRDVSWLQNRDRDVRAHEAAHEAAGGSLVGAPSFQYEVGPDGRTYAIGGDVTVNVSIVPGDPQATVTRMDQVRAAALAPADPSAQDDLVAAEAAALAMAAEMQVNDQQQEAQGAAHSADATGGVPTAGASWGAPATDGDGTMASEADRQRQSRMVVAYAATNAAAASADAALPQSPGSGSTPLFA